MLRRHNLTIYQGQDFEFTYDPDLGDLSGSKIQMSIKTDLWANPSIHLTTADGSIEVDGHELTIKITSEQTNAMDELGINFLSRDRKPLDMSVEFIYDAVVELSNGASSRVLWGDVTYYRAVT